MNRITRLVAFIVSLGALGIHGAQAQQQGLRIEISSDRPTGVCQVGDPVAFQIQLLSDGKPPPGKKVYYRISQGQELAEGVFVNAAEPERLSFSAHAPGFITCMASFQESNPEWPAVISSTGWFAAEAQIFVVVAPDRIQAQTPSPEDFMAFWNKQKARLGDMPMNASSRPVEVRNARVKAFAVKADCPGGLPVVGYVAMPVDADKDRRYPARVIFQGHTYFPGDLAPPVNEADAAKMICFTVSAYGLETGQPREYYTQRQGAWRTPGGAYPYLNWDAPEKVFFTGMFLRVLRALEYIKSLPEWDGANLIVEGSSMGGAQALIAAALDPQVTRCMANCPALCDLLAKAPGWPMLPHNVKHYPSLMRQHAPYYDMVNFAPHVRAKTLIGMGVCDSLCPPANIYAIYNGIRAPKEIVVSPRGGHGWTPEVLGHLQRLPRTYWIQ